VNANNSGGKCSDPQLDAGFPREARLTKPSDFKRVFDKPFVSSDRFFKILAKPGAAECWRLGMAVSRQIDKRATARNRIKRIVRESFRRQRGVLAAYHPVLDLVVLPRRGIASISSDCLTQSLTTHWARLERIADGHARAEKTTESTGHGHTRHSNPLNC